MAIEVEVFQAGTYPQGVFTEEDLEQIAADYSPERHEAPITLDHTRSGPAYGWVAGLRRQGDKLLATFRDMAEQFKELVRGGRYKKPSAEIYLNFPGTGRKYLRAVTFLGARVPAVKGLAQAHFADAGPFVSISLAEAGQEGEVELETILARVVALLKGKGIEVDPEELKAAVEAQDGPATFGEADIKAAEERGRRAAGAQFAEERRKDEIAVFCKQQLNAGKLIPAWLRAGLKEFMTRLDSADVVQFAEGGPKQSAYGWFKTFLEGQPKFIHFEEIAPDSEDIGPRGDTPGELLLSLAQARAAEKKVSLSVAFAEVEAEHPELVNEYLAERPGA